MFVPYCGKPGLINHFLVRRLSSCSMALPRVCVPLLGFAICWLIGFAFVGAWLMSLYFEHTAASETFLSGTCRFDASVSIVATGCRRRVDNKGHYYHYPSMVAAVQWELVGADGVLPGNSTRYAASECLKEKDCRCSGCSLPYRYIGPKARPCHCSAECEPAARESLKDGGVEPVGGDAWVQPGDSVPCWYNPEDVGQVWFNAPSPVTYLILGVAAISFAGICGLLCLWQCCSAMDIGPVKYDDIFSDV